MRVTAPTVLMSEYSDYPYILTAAMVNGITVHSLKPTLPQNRFIGNVQVLVRTILESFGSQYYDENSNVLMS